MEDIVKVFFKCTKWQREETSDPLICPYSYFCDSVYPGDYSAAVDVSIFLLSAASYAFAVAATLLDLAGESPAVDWTQRLRVLLPSGPVVLPALLLALVNGHRTGAAIPLSSIGPAFFQLVLLSALAFENPPERTLRHVLLVVSSISGILHASFRLDAVILPYYTGLDALLRSTLSGECPTCVCRQEALVVGGNLVSYRGWSTATFAVAGTLLCRFGSLLCGEEKIGVAVKSAVEALAWVLIGRDWVDFIGDLPPGELMEMAAHVAVCLLMSLQILRRACSLLVWLGAMTSL
ncbi:unnamed protein product [Spirodela intermedia]|uniref:Uncharacterized protein n=1 Tax=Spirodela intermedia TaxID=51605 RepID=A0A7I8K463_SPIIN|nr:unnamed protein product [Spirodela intermedia]